MINLTIKNLFVFREEIAQFKNIKKNKDEIKKEKDVYDKEYYSIKNYKNYDFNIFENIDTKTLKGISLENVYLFINDTISTCFKNIYINEFFIKIGFFDDEKRIEELFNLYIDLIKKSNIFFIQELQIISHTLIDSLTISDLHLQYNIIFSYLLHKRLIFWFFIKYSNIVFSFIFEKSKNT